MLHNSVQHVPSSFHHNATKININIFHCYDLIILEYSGIELSKTIMAQRCERIVSTLLADWKYFKSIENPNILVVKVRNNLSNCLSVSFYSTRYNEIKLSTCLSIIYFCIFKGS
jgi:hypothetical protein